MIEQVPLTLFESTTVRLVSFKTLAGYLSSDLGLSPDDSSELMELLQSRDFPMNPEDIVAVAFEPKPNLQPEGTRFSNGYIRIFYSALELETARHEVQYWFGKSLPVGNQPTAASYRELHSKFDGHVKDLRPVAAEMPFLTADDGYPLCQEIGKEVSESDAIDALLTPSARLANGTCIPVFRRESIKAASWGSEIAIVVPP